MENIFGLFILNLRREIRQWAQLLGLILLAWVVAYLVYRTSPSNGVDVFNFVYWIFVLLISINATMRVESHDSEEERIFLYTLTDPFDTLMAKLIFNFVYISLIAILFYLAVLLFFAPVVVFSISYILLLLSGALVIAACMTLVTAIGFASGGQTTLVSILGLPLLIPAILILNKIGKTILQNDEIVMVDVYSLIGIIMISISASLFLYPVVWKQ